MAKISNTNDERQTKKRQSRRAKSTRINLVISNGLLERVDEAAKKEFTTRSDVLRTAVVWYLQPRKRQFDQLNNSDALDEIIKPLKQRKMKAELKKFLQENKDEIDVYDT